MISGARGGLGMEPRGYGNHSICIVIVLSFAHLYFLLQYCFLTFLPAGVAFTGKRKPLILYLEDGVMGMYA